MSNKGTDYEKKIFGICKEAGCIFPGTTYAGGGAGADIVLKHNQKPLSVECKSAGADWGQEGLKYKEDRWVWNNTDEVTEFFDAMNVIGEIDPNFIPYNKCPNGMRESDWAKVKKNIIGHEKRKHDQTNFEKGAIPLSLEVLEKYYNEKGTYYLQFEGFGFFHLGKDIHNLNTPAFNGKITLRFRAKSHDNYERRGKGEGISKNGKKITLTKLKEIVLDDVDTEVFDRSIFKVETNMGSLSIQSYQELLDLIEETKGKEKLFEGASLRIQKFTDQDNTNDLFPVVDPTCEFEIKPIPWNYSFFAAIKLDKAPSRSHLSLEPQKNQRFPEIFLS